jgi:hypothetical protein
MCTGGGIYWQQTGDWGEGGGGVTDDRLDSFTIDTCLLPGPDKPWRNQEANRSSLKITTLRVKVYCRVRRSSEAQF